MLKLLLLNPDETELVVFECEPLKKKPLSQPLIWMALNWP